MIPFKVTFNFQSPLVVESEYPIHLDALIAWAVVHEAESAGIESPWDAGNDLSHLLDSAENEHGKVWKASRLVFTPLRERILMNMIRMSNPETFLHDLERGHFQHKRTISGINTRSGQYRAYQMFVPYQWMEKAEAWGIGDIEEIRYHLSLLKNIGKMGRNGFGVIRNISIEEDNDVAEKWRLRVLPLGLQGLDTITYEPSFHCLQPPYWKKTNRVSALEPII